MATNPFFSNYQPEQNLVEDITVEVIKATGRDCVYVPREYFSIDQLFGEDPGTKFTNSYTIEMYLQSYKGFEGSDIISQFGLEIRDKISLVLARKRFKEEVTNKNSNIRRPREGDLIYFPTSKSLFEINFVEHENPFYPLGRLYSYMINAELFTYSYEKIATNNADINKVYSTTHGNATTEITPKNNMLGTTLGIGEVLDAEAADYNFDPNDPNFACDGGNPEAEDHTILVYTFGLGVGSGFPAVSSTSNILGTGYYPYGRISANPDRDETLVTAAEVKQWFEDNPTAAPLGKRAIMPFFINAAFSDPIQWVNNSFPGSTYGAAFNGQDFVKDSGGNFVLDTISQNRRPSSQQNNTIYGGNQNFMSPWYDNAASRTKTIWTNWLQSVKDEGITFDYVMGNISDTSIFSNVSIWSENSGLRLNGTAGNGNTFHFNYILQDPRMQSSSIGNASIYGTLHSQLKLDQGFTLGSFNYNEVNRGISGGASAAYILWNFVVSRLGSYYIEDAFYSPLQSIMPNAQVSNYGNLIIDKENQVSDFNGHYQNYYNKQGNALGAICYGQMGQVAFNSKISTTDPTILEYDASVTGTERFGYDSSGITSAWRCVQLDQQQLKAMLRSGTEYDYFHAWVKSATDTVDSAFGGQLGLPLRPEYYRENIYHICMANVDAIFYFNQYGGIQWNGVDGYINNDTWLTDAIEEVNTLKNNKRASPLAQCKQKLDYSKHFLASGCKLYNGKHLFRVTTNYDKVNTLVIRGTSYDVTAVPGVWYLADNDINDLEQTAYNSNSKTLYIT